MSEPTARQIAERTPDEVAAAILACAKECARYDVGWEALTLAIKIEVARLVAAEVATLTADLAHRDEDLADAVNALAERTADLAQARQEKQMLAVDYLSLDGQAMELQQQLAEALQARDAALAALKRWRGWVQFVMLSGGPVTLDDEALQAAACAANDKLVSEARRQVWEEAAQIAKDGQGDCDCCHLIVQRALPARCARRGFAGVHLVRSCSDGYRPECNRNRADFGRPPLRLRGLLVLVPDVLRRLLRRITTGL